MRQLALDMQTGARFSPCGYYRYTLWRYWDENPPLLWLLLNPSTADEFDNDPTVERCQRRTITLGFGGIRVANIFAYRSTDRSVLKHLDDPIGPENDASIIEMASDAGGVVCGWGNDGALNKRSTHVRKLLANAGITAQCLKMTAVGEPWHPLYIGYDVALRPMPSPN